MQDSMVSSQLQPAVHDSPMPHRSAHTLAAALHHVRQLGRDKQLILVGLVALALLIIVATTAYVLIPATSVPARVAAPGVGVIPTAAKVPGQPNVSGQYTLADVSTKALTFHLQEFGMNVTGTITTQNCTGTPVTTIVTGHFIAANALILTLVTPNVAQATTTLYTLTPTDNGFSLSWRDSAGQAQVQHWVTAAATNTPCK